MYRLKNTATAKFSPRRVYEAIHGITDEGS